MKNNQNHTLHTIVKDKILDLIKSEKYKADDRLPTEAEFCRLFEVSRTTVRIALQQLELEGRIYRTQGKGTFVGKSKIQQSLTSASKGFTQQMIEQGLHPEIKVLELQVSPANKTLAAALQIEQNDPLNKLVRIRYANDEPIQYEVSNIPWKIAPGLVQEECQGSLFQLLEEKFKVRIWRTVEAVEPVLADEKISASLNIPIGAPCLSVETTTYSTNKIPIEYSYAVFRGDRSKFIVERMYSSLEDE